MIEALFFQCLIDRNENIDFAIEHGIKAEDFANANFNKLYKYLLDRWTQNLRTDVNILITVFPAAFISDLYKDVCSLSMFRYYLAEIKEGITKKKIFDLCKKISSSKDPSNKLLENLNLEAMKISNDTNVVDYVRVYDALKIVYSDVLYRIENDKSEFVIKSKFSNLDDIIIGFSKGDFVLIAARPSVGKSAFAINLFEKMKDNALAFFSLEMSKNSILSRLICCATDTPSSRIRSPYIPSEQIEKIDNYVKSFKERNNIYLDNSARLTTMQLLLKAKKMKRETGIDVIFVDYLQLLDSANFFKTKREQVEEISRSLKFIAKELDCVVIALSQLSRKVEDRIDGRPRLSDLRETGALEQDADKIFFLHRKNSEQDEVSQISLIVAKNREGETKDCLFDYNKTYQKFFEKT